MAIISTADSLLCAISSNIALDLFSSKTNNKVVITRARIITIICGLAAYIACLYTNDIIQIIVKGYELTIICFFIPIIFVIFSNYPSKIAGRFSCFCGITSYILLSNDLFMPVVVLSLLISTAGYLFARIMWE